MKKMLLLICVIFSMHNLWATPGFAAGSGTSGDPYQITTPAELNIVRNYLSAGMYFKLMNDIDLTSYLASGGSGYAAWGVSGWMPIGNGSNYFYGQFNGNNKKITGLKINRVGEYHVGLFGFLGSGGRIENLGVEIDAAGSVKGTGSVGGLVGSTMGTISKCYSTGAVEITTEGGGGLAGIVYGGPISNCYSTASLTPVGSCNYYGGFVGLNQGTITNCYSTGNITGTGTQVGGFLGFNDGFVTNCFWDTETSGKSTSAAGSGKTTALMKTPSTFTGWDFITLPVWKIMENTSYPYLAWENKTLAGPYTVGAGGDYTTLDDVVADLGNYGVSGEVTLQLTPGATYTGTLTIDDIPGNSATNRLIIESDPLNPATIIGASGKADESPLTLNGDAFMTFQDLNFTNNSTVAGTSAILFNDGAKNKTINHCTIKAGSNAVETYGIKMGNDCDNNVITNNTILKAQVGIYVESDVSTSNNLQITGNDIGSVDDSESIGKTGIYMSYCEGAVISQNTIHDIKTDPEAFGMYIMDLTNSQVTRNNVHNIIGSGDCIGIFVQLPNNSTFANNMISAIGSSTSITVVGMYFLFASSDFNIWYNTVNLTGTLTMDEQTGTIALALGRFNETDIVNIDLRNNILINTMSNTTFAGSVNYAIYTNMPNTAFTNIDYNNYYVSAAQGVLGSMVDTDYTTLAAWQTATGQDLHSQNHGVLFVDTPVQPGQLQYQRVPFNQCLFNTGTALALTATDFYGNNRLAYDATDIGAHEMLFNSDVAESLLPQNTSLSQNYPNPFNPETAINFALAKDAKVNLTVYNVKGEVVRSLVNNNLKAGYHTVNFNATGLNSGVYVYKMTTPDNSFTKKMILVK